MRWMVFVVWASAAAAQNLSIEEAPVKRDIALECAFVTECFDGEGCSATSFDADIIGRAGGLSEDTMTTKVIMSSVSGNVDLIGITAPDAMALSGGSFEARHMVTISGTDARYTVHYTEGPMAITYLGACK